MLLQTAALAALGLALFGVSWLDARSKPRALVLVDRSQSMPRAASDKALTEVVRAAQATGVGELQVLEFAGKPAAPAAQAGDGAAPLEASATNIEAALDAALAAHAATAFDSLVLISDGHANRGDTARALRAVRQARLPLQWLAVGRAPPATRITQVLAPGRAQVGQRLQVSVQLAGRLDQPLRVKASARTPGGDVQAATSEVGSSGRASFEFDARRAAALVVDLTLEDARSGQALNAMPDAAVIDVRPRAAMLYAQGSNGPLAQSLLRGGWELEVVAAAQLDAHADGLDGYQSVVLDDVAIADASPRFWNALVAAVKQRGLGLLVLGGERSFARGGYRGSVLETVLPVVSEPAALDQPAAIVFAVDKSGSMGQGSGGVDRFQLAQRAVLETARGLGERDSLGLVVFDVVPRVLIPLGPAAAATQALARDWPASPNGGTKLVPALEAAVGELEGSGAARRMLVIVTDGFVDEVPVAALRARLARSRIETIALAIGPDADVDALQRVVGPDAGQVLRVDQAAELPLVMRSGLERRRARIERGNIAVEQRQALPFSPATLQGWPPITAHFVTRSQAQAVVAVQSQRGDPLIAFQSSGRGRVVALTCGLGPWTAPWLRWPEWPRLAGGLADWVNGTADAVSLTVTDLPGGLQLDAETHAGARRNDSAAVTVDTPTAQGRRLALDAIAAGRLRTTLPDDGPGLYSFAISDSPGTQRHLHLRRHHGEDESWGTNAELDVWRAAGLLNDWNPPVLAQVHERHRGSRPMDRSLIGVALAFFLSGVLVDRARLDKAGITNALARWRQRAP